MSWITITLIVVLAAFGCTYGLCEWLIRRARVDNDDPSAQG